jgi:transcriptional regulator with XRE-family HTH domain
MSLTDTIARNVRERRLARGWNQKVLAARAGLRPEDISRIEHAERRVREERLASVARALQCEIIDLKSEGRRSIQREASDPLSLSVEYLIEKKLFADFAKSAISHAAKLEEAKSIYSSRLSAVLSDARYRHLKPLESLRDFDWMSSNLSEFSRTYNSTSTTRESRQDLDAILRFTKHSPLRVGCAILAGPVSTMYSLQERLEIPMHIEMTHAYGVELMACAADRGTSLPYDFLVVATGAFNLTLVGLHNRNIYEPVLPVHYESQECLYRPSKSKEFLPRIRTLFYYDYSSGDEERRVRSDVLGAVERKPQMQFRTLVEIFPEIDDGQVVNVWEPLTEVLKQNGWAKAAIPAYESQICLYQDKRFSGKTLNHIGMAFKRLFIIEWMRLGANPREALGYLFGKEAFRRRFVDGSGLNVRLWPALAAQ